jgi:hypothetical protein
MVAATAHLGASLLPRRADRLGVTIAIGVCRVPLKAAFRNLFCQVRLNLLAYYALKLLAYQAPGRFVYRLLREPSVNEMVVR